MGNSTSLSSRHRKWRDTLQQWLHVIFIWLQPILALNSIWTPYDVGFESQPRIYVYVCTVELVRRCAICGLVKWAAPRPLNLNHPTPSYLIDFIHIVCPEMSRFLPCVVQYPHLVTSIYHVSRRRQVHHRCSILNQKLHAYAFLFLQGTDAVDVWKLDTRSLFSFSLCWRSINVEKSLFACRIDMVYYLPGPTLTNVM